MIIPNLQLIYVSDVGRSTAFYKMLFGTDPVFSSPRYVAFSAGGEALFALWSGGETPDPSAPRFSEVGIMLKSDSEVDSLYETWKQNGDIVIAKEIETAVFGRTFLIKDPDGNIIRVCSRD